MNEVEALTWERWPHKNGKFACEVCFEHNLIRFVDRGGTIEYNYAAEKAKAMRRRAMSGAVVAGAVAVSE